ncbi:MAG: VRR-NUC domain-containing protein [Micrococcus sp.]|nr:VRR-NUC domain-containing protein [Micrococcus sp.]
MKVEEYRTILAKGMSEDSFQDEVIRLAKIHGWKYYHTHDSRRSVAGFPDLVLVHPSRGVLWRELKKWNGRVSKEQQEWLDRLADAGEDAGVWRPMDWLDGTIEKELRGWPRERCPCRRE